tara:strand:+ start:597 stop:866 length:270 start_codon:yes stop_codon:yes gene_type:complete
MTGIVILMVVVLFLGYHYFNTKGEMNEEERLGKEQLKNLENMDSMSKEIVLSWAKEMMLEVGTSDIHDKRVLRYIGLKVQQSRQIKGGF